ncbi:SAM-dependent methyltransferase [Streptomyces sp. NA02950]|uniref:SAM-dependent methyltransferase n=1 Tax=Streptomyces sp. NA02950 TaxID=2742137 RepID=UPI0015915B9C|nr:SAM-dependent methyltransferase [Streptomyces sp. NA02950]QKV96806.1 SAM-dependent methyltransferase [Streptomyces sp. NA02950]
MPELEPGPSRIDTSRPHPARVYDYILGGKNNYPVDEELAKRVLAIDPTVTTSARTNRAFMRHATEWLARAGIRQYLDIGTGIPTEPNLHQIAQAIAPDARIVYTDNDPIVLCHAEALLRSTPQGLTHYLEADVRDPDRIVQQAGEVLDFGEPIALSLISLMHFIDDGDGAYDLVRRLVEALAPGSHLVLSHATADGDAQAGEEVVALYRRSGVTLRPRSHAEVARFFEGLEPVGSGLVRVSDWRPDIAESTLLTDGEQVTVYAGLARKP